MIIELKTLSESENMIASEELCNIDVNTVLSIDGKIESNM